MGDRELPAGGMDLSYATPLPGRKGRGVVVVVALGLALAAGLGALMFLLRLGYTMSVRLAPPATAPATAPAAPPATVASPAVPGIPGYVPPPPPKLDLPETPPRLTIHQRGSEPVPGSDGTVHVTIGDITGGQVQVGVTASNRGTLASQTLREGEAVEFAFDGKRYVIVASEFRLRLMGQDRGVFVVRRAEDPPTEEEKIGHLIAAAAAAKAVVTTQPDTPAADEYLRSLWRTRRASIKTAQELVRQAGQETIRFPDGKESALDAWLKAELK
jgi:hypothetical protein